MVVYSAVIFGGLVTIGFNGVSQALFLGRLPASDLPWAFILPAAAITPGLLIYNRLAVRFALLPLTILSLIVLAGIGIGLRWSLSSPYGSSFPVVSALYLYCEFVASLSLLQFWTIAPCIFHARQARRLYGLITAGGTAAVIVAGIALSGLSHIFGVENLFLFVVASLIICAGCVLALRRQLQEGLQPSNSVIRTSLVNDLVAVRRVPLLRIIATLTVILSLLINIGAYQFFLALHAHFRHHSADIAVYLGVFAIVSGLVALVMQFYITPRVLVHFGAVTALFFLPVAMAGASLAGLTTGGALWTMAAIRGSDPALRRTITDSALNVLYVPIPAPLRRQAKSLTESAYALAFGLAGIVFLLSEGFQSYGYLIWSVPLLALTVLWGVLLLPIRNQYARALSESLQRRRLTFPIDNLQLADRKSISLLQQALNDPDPRRVVHVLEIISDLPSPLWEEHVIPLLGHESAVVRAQTLRFLSVINSRRPVPVASLLDDADAEVRAAAVHAVAARSPDRVTRLQPLLAVSDYEVKAATVSVLLSGTNDTATLAALTELRSLFQGPVPARIAAARVLGSLAGVPLSSELVASLDEIAGPEPAAASLPVRCLFPLLLDTPTRIDAGDALIGYRHEAIPILNAIIENRQFDSRLRCYACQLLGHLDSAAIPVLLRHLTAEDDAVRLTVAQTLEALCESGAPADRHQLRARVYEELRNLYVLHIIDQDLDLSSQSILHRALTEKGGEIMAIILALLASLYPGVGLGRVPAALRGDVAQRTNAIELLATVIDRVSATHLLPLLEGSPVHVFNHARTLQIETRSSHDRLAELAGSPDSWLRACAFFEIGQSADPSFQPQLLAALGDSDEIVRETIEISCGPLLGTVL